MNVGFFIQGSKDSVHWQIAKSMITSARKVMPEVDLYQLTDDKTPAHDDVKVLRLDGDMPMAVRRMKHHASMDGDWCFVDTDVIFKKDVREVFDESFDVALTDRIGTYMEGTEYGLKQPYNMGVTFSRNKAFWQAVLDKLLNYPSKYQQWEGDQRVVCGMAESEHTPFEIMILPGKIYNFTPEKEQEDCSHASIIHYKGLRKAWIK